MLNLSSSIQQQKHFGKKGKEKKKKKRLCVKRRQNLGAENEDPSGFGLSNKALLAISLQDDRDTPYGRWTPLRGGSYHSEIQQRQRPGTTNNNSITLSISFMCLVFFYTYDYRYSPRLYGLVSESLLCGRVRRAHSWSTMCNTNECRSWPTAFSRRETNTDLLTDSTARAHHHLPLARNPQ